MSEKPTISTPNIDLDKNPQQIMSPKVPSMPKIPKPTKTNQVGVAPDSKKDPIKQAQQLKNKDDKKIAMQNAISMHKNNEQWSLDNQNADDIQKRAPKDVDPEKHERCVIDVKQQGHDVGSAHAICSASINKNNEQWSLEKKKSAFNPRQEHNTTGGELRNKWVNHMSQEARDSIPRMEGSARTRAMSKLAGDTQYRRNPHTNKIEFLMHRGISSEELKNNHNLDSNLTRYNTNDKNGWTPKLHVAHDFGVYGHDDGQKGHVVSAWVPEDHLHSSLRQYGSDDPDTQKMLSDEDEWIIHHKEPMHHESIVPADKSKIKPLANK